MGERDKRKVRSGKKKALEALTENITERPDESDNSDECSDEETVLSSLTTHAPTLETRIQKCCSLQCHCLNNHAAELSESLVAHDSHTVYLEEMVASIAVSCGITRKAFVLLFLIVITVFVESEMDTSKQ